MPRPSAIIVLAAAVGLAAPAEAATMVELAPSSAWRVDYAGERCNLYRTFGQGDETATMAFALFEPEGRFQMMFAGPLVRDTRSAVPLRIRFGAEAEQKIAYMVGQGTRDTVLMLSGSYDVAPLTQAQEDEAERAEKQGLNYEAPRIAGDRLNAIDGIAIKGGFRHPVKLMTGPMGPAIARLRQCGDDLVKSWGLDPDNQRTLSRKPQPSGKTANWLDWTDYPADMLQRNQEGVINARLMVDAAGAPESCVLQASAGDATFQEVVCSKLMKKARFVPALDAQGAPVRSYWTTAVRFMMP